VPPPHAGGDSKPEPPTPGVADPAAGGRASALSPQAIEAVLADFRAWLSAADVAEPPPAAEEVDLFTLLGQLTALRHEVNLQTRAVRAQQEQGAEALRQLAAALDVARQAQAAARERDGAGPDERVRPLLQTLVDLYDALALAGREIGRAQETVVPVLQGLAADLESPKEEAEPAPPAAPPRPSWWGRFFGTPTSDAARLRAEVERLRDQRRGERRAQAERASQARDAAERIRQALGALVTGYSMSLQRVERALRQHGLEPIAAVGRPFDPERMEVLDAVAGGGRPPGEVLDEVRRGYLWNGRVFRYAQVRVAKA
jgi:molecular chaperone GrpE